MNFLLFFSNETREAHLDATTGYNPKPEWFTGCALEDINRVLNESDFSPTSLEWVEIPSDYTDDIFYYLSVKGPAPFTRLDQEKMNALKKMFLDLPIVDIAHISFEGSNYETVHLSLRINDQGFSCTEDSDGNLIYVSTETSNAYNTIEDEILNYAQDEAIETCLVNIPFKEGT